MVASHFSCFNPKNQSLVSPDVRLKFSPEDEESMFLQNVGIYIQVYMVL
jgi:hypothetical protein